MGNIDRYFRKNWSKDDDEPLIKLLKKMPKKYLKIVRRIVEESMQREYMILNTTYDGAFTISQKDHKWIWNKTYKVIKDLEKLKTNRGNQ